MNVTAEQLARALYEGAWTHGRPQWAEITEEYRDREVAHAKRILNRIQQAVQPARTDPDYPPNPAIVEAFTQASKEHRSFMNPVGFDDSNTAREWRDRKK